MSRITLKVHGNLILHHVCSDQISHQAQISCRIPNQHIVTLFSLQYIFQSHGTFPCQLHLTYTSVLEAYWIPKMLHVYFNMTLKHLCDHILTFCFSFRCKITDRLCFGILSSGHDIVNLSMVLLFISILRVLILFLFL